MNIESDKNPKIKNLVKLLEKSRERKSQRKFIVEGRQENFFALENNFQPLEFYIQPEIFKSSLKLPQSVPLYEVSATVYNKLAYRKITEGIIGVFEYEVKKLPEISMSETPFILVIESIEKPGNLGAICRTADAFGADMVIVCEEKTDIYNPNVIRSSVGSFFNVPVISATNEEVYTFLTNKSINLYGTFMNEQSISVQNADLVSSCAILFGTEHQGVSDYWRERIDKNVLIPMKGKIDSLNVSNAVAIISYEVERQRIAPEKA
ncbi:RNA methyltransferase [Apibacter raozihei]|uniref:TrmH family RNA methyltransferase n=1 Tax=Apibacter raozihei TaxID=2500547 RepID=UPI000FE35D06|nr:RNA methyltransferase [Apibacter raozihei]